MILGAPCAHRAPGVGDFPWGPRRLVAVPVAPPAPRRRPVRPEVVARGRSRESRRSASLSCRRQLLLRAAERPARPWSLSLSRLSLSFVRNNLPPQCCRQVPELHTRLRRAPPPHTRVSPQTPGRRGRPRHRAHRLALSPQTAGCTWTCRSSTRKRRSRSRSCRTSCCGTTSTAGSPCACLGLGPGVDAGGDVPGAGARCGGGTQAPLPPAVVSAAVRTPTKTSEWGA